MQAEEIKPVDNRPGYTNNVNMNTTMHNTNHNNTNHFNNDRKRKRSQDSFVTILPGVQSSSSSSSSSLLFQLENETPYMKYVRLVRPCLKKRFPIETNIQLGMRLGKFWHQLHMKQKEFFKKKKKLIMKNKESMMFGHSYTSTYTRIPSKRNAPSLSNASSVAAAATPAAAATTTTATTTTATATATTTTATATATAAAPITTTSATATGPTVAGSTEAGSTENIFQELNGMDKNFLFPIDAIPTNLHTLALMQRVSNVTFLVSAEDAIQSMNGNLALLQITQPSAKPKVVIHPPRQPHKFVVQKPSRYDRTDLNDSKNSLVIGPLVMGAEMDFLRKKKQEELKITSTSIPWTEQEDKMVMGEGKL